MVGTAAGRMTFWKSRAGPSPMDRADLISRGSTVFTPLIVLSRMGQEQAYSTNVIFVVSPMPRMSVNTGSSATAEVLRKISSSGVRASATGRYQPISRPSGMASAMAKPNPDRERTSEARRCSGKGPTSSNSYQTRRSSDSGGTNTGSNTPSRGSVSHAASSRRIAADLVAARDTVRRLLRAHVDGPEPGAAPALSASASSSASSSGRSYQWTSPGNSLGSRSPRVVPAAGSLRGSAMGVRRLPLLRLRRGDLVAQQGPHVVAVLAERRARPQIIRAGVEG